MSEVLLSVGLDIGTTSTQMVVSRLQIENRASEFAVPEMEITGREILYRSPVHFTPMVEDKLVDGEKIRMLVEEEYRNAGILPEKVDTGAVIITGETSRKENAGTVLNALAEYAGDFVVATAGPDLESVLAAKGAGAVEYSQKTGKTVLHMDIGGGTSNLALIRDGKIVSTGCLNVGGRLCRFDPQGKVTYVSPILARITAIKTGDIPTAEEINCLVEILAEALEMAAGRKDATGLLEELTTKETGRPWNPPEEICVISFSGGVADCIASQYPPGAFGDIGPALGRAIRGSSLCREGYILGKETIRATVIGAGCHTTQLSGSTVFHRNIRLPLKNIPVVRASEEMAPKHALSDRQTPRILAMTGKQSPSYLEISRLAETIASDMEPPILLCLEQDMAKALGQALAVRLPEDTPILCIDRIRIEDGSYLDVGVPVGSALPVVVKTLVLAK